MKQPTLSEYLNGRGSARGEYVLHGRFAPIYVRRTPRYVLGAKYMRVCTIANITLPRRHRNKGEFSRLIKWLAERGWHIYVECVQNETLPAKLAHLGFHRVNTATFGD